MSSKFNSILSMLLASSIGVVSANLVHASDTSKITAEKRAQLNKLLAEAAKQAGIELEDEELTIVIVKKPGKEQKPSNEDDGQVISNVANEGANTPSISDDNSENSTKETEQNIALSETDKARDEEPTLAVPITDQPEQLHVTQSKSLGETNSAIEDKERSTIAQSSENKPTINSIADTPSTASPSVKSTPDEPQVAATEEFKPSVSETTNSITETNPEIQVPQTVEELPQEAKVITALEPKQDPSSNTEDVNIKETQEELTSVDIAVEQTNDEKLASKQTPSVIVSTDESTELPTTTIQEIIKTEPLESNHSDEYYGNYISPNRQIDSYYSSDIMEAISKVSPQNSNNLEIPAEHIGSIKLAQMESNEMSDLVVEGALDATAAGGVSTTTLKTAVVVPDTTQIEDLDKELEDEDIEELKEALNKKDLNKRVKDALAQLSRNQTRSSSSSVGNIGTMNASGVNVTATLSSRVTNNSVSNFRQTNLNNTNF